MCYPKPGPRCSNHTMKAYNSAVEKHGPYSKEAFDTLQEYLKTPEGIKRLRSEGQHELAQQYEQQRADAIKAYHAARRREQAEAAESRARELFNDQSINVTVEPDEDGLVFIVTHDPGQYCNSVTEMPGYEDFRPNLIEDREALLARGVKAVVADKVEDFENSDRWRPSVWAEDDADYNSRLNARFQEVAGEGVKFRVKEVVEDFPFDHSDAVSDATKEFRSIEQYDYIRGCSELELDTISRTKGFDKHFRKDAKRELARRRAEDREG